MSEITFRCDHCGKTFDLPDKCEGFSHVGCVGRLAPVPAAPAPEATRRATEAGSVSGYGIVECRGHWHVTDATSGDHLIVPGDPFPTREAALDAADELNRDAPEATREAVQPDPSVPLGEIHFVQDGKTVGKIVNVALADPWHEPRGGDGMSETLTVQEREQFRAFVEKYPDTPLADAMRKWEVALASAEDSARDAIAQAKGLEAERAAQARENETLRAALAKIVAEWDADAKQPRTTTWSFQAALQTARNLLAARAPEPQP